MDAFAAIVTVDPPSLVAWLVVAFAASLYPVGLFFSGCPCCQQGCGALPYVRCRRDECLSCSPRSSVSRRVYAISGAAFPDPSQNNAGTGAVLVCTRHRLSVSSVGSQFIYLSAGESQTVTVTQLIGSEPVWGPVPTATITPASGGASVPGVFSITVQGVDVPLTVTVYQLPYVFGSTAGPQTDRFSFGGDSFWPTERASVSAALSIHTRGVSVLGNSQYLDPAVVTESALLAMLTFSAVTHRGGDAFQADWTFTPDAALFEYLPLYYSVQLNYTVEFRRGSASVFRTVQAVVSKNGGTVTALPEGGLPPLSLPTRNFTDTPNSMTPAIVNGTNITLFSNSSAIGRTQDYFYDPVGVSLFFSPNYAVSPHGFYNAVTRHISCETTRYVFDPFGHSGYTQVYPPFEFAYNFNHDEVDEFIRGERCLQYTMNGVNYERCIEPANPLCALGICDRPGLLPQTATFNVGLPCGGSISLVGRLVSRTKDFPFTNTGCKYYAGIEACVMGYSGQIFSVEASSFFDGDLLYAIENGPSRQAVSLDNYGGWAYPQSSTPVSASIGGNADASGISYRLVCPEGSIAHYSGKCLPESISISLSGSLGAVTYERTDFDGVLGSHAEQIKQRLLKMGEEVVEMATGGTVSVLSSGRNCTYAEYGWPRYWPPPVSGVYGFAGIDKCGQVAAEGSQRARKTEELRLENQTMDGGTAELVYQLSAFCGVGHDGTTVTEAGFSRPSGAVGYQVWGWQGTGQAGSVTVSTTNASRVYSTLTTSPQSFDWKGGNYSWAYTHPNGTTLTGTRSVPVRSDAIQGNLPVGEIQGLSVGGISGLPAIANVEQGFRQCAAMGVSARWPGMANLVGSTSYTAQAAGATGLIALGFERDAICEEPFTATASANWITVRLNTDLRTFCVDIAPNYTGQQRSGTIAISPVWLLNGSPSSSTSAAIGTFNYAITQSA